MQLTSAQVKLKERAAELSRGLVRQRGIEIDKSGEYPWDVVEALKNERFMGMTIPKELGGQGLSFLDAVLVIEEMAKSCTVTARIVVESNMGAISTVMAYGRLAGTLMVFLKAGTTPMSLHWTESGNVLIMVIFGGIGTLLGPIIGATVFVFVRDEFTTRFQAWQFAFGLVFVLVVLAFPRGLVGIFNRIRMSPWRTHS